jgi:hypothetical protein
MATRPRTRTPKPKTAIQIAREFCQAHLGKYCFAPFTGQDYSAWAAFVYAMELWCRGDHDGMNGAVIAMRSLLRAAQDKEDVQRLFLQAIPATGDWCHVEQLWPKIAVNAPAGFERRLRDGENMQYWTAVGQHRDPLQPAVRS